MSSSFGPTVTPLATCLAPARAWLTAGEDPEHPRRSRGWSSCRCRGSGWLGGRVGDVLTLHDSRGAKRRLFTVTQPRCRRHGTSSPPPTRPTYLATGTVLHVDRADDPTEVGPLPELEQSLLLRRGDMLDVTRDCSPARIPTASPRSDARSPRSSTTPASAKRSTSTTAASAARSRPSTAMSCGSGSSAPRRPAQGCARPRASTFPTREVAGVGVDRQGRRRPGHGGRDRGPR